MEKSSTQMEAMALKHFNFMLNYVELCNFESNQQQIRENKHS